MGRVLKKYFPIFLLPTLIIFSIFLVLPFLVGIYLSFCDFVTIEDSIYVGFKNYIDAVSNKSSFWYSLGITSLYSLISILSVNLIALGLALLLTKKLRFKNIYRSIFFLPNLIGGIVLGHIWSVIINGILQYFNTDLTAEFSYGFFALIVVSNWQLIGYMMIIYIAGLENVSNDLIEAAKIDGASNFKTLTKVKLPLIASSITICSFLTLSNTFKMFDQNLALTSGAPYEDGIYKTSFLALDIYRSFYGSSNSSGLGQAKAVLFFVILMIISYIQLRITRKKELEL